MSNELIIPKILIDERNFCQKINSNNLIMSSHIDYLRRMILEIHKVYQKLCIRVNEISQNFQTKANNQIQQNSHAIIASNFVSNINSMHININHQLNNNNVNIGTKTHIICKNRFQILQKKLIFSDNLMKQFLTKVNSYNIKQKKFRQNCEYFKDYQQDVMKYYALKANTSLYDNYSSEQLKLKEKIEDIARKKDQYQINISQIRITIKQFYEMQINMISQYKRLILSIRKQNIQKSKAKLAIIQQQMQQSYSQIIKKSQTILEQTLQKNKQKSIAQKRRQIQRQYEKGDQFENWFEQFLKQYRYQLICTGQRIDSIRQGKEYQKFHAQNQVITQILPLQSVKDIQSILNQITFFRELILKIQHICGKIKVISQLRKYRGNSYNKFIEDTNGHLERQKKTPNSSQLKLEYETLQYKYRQSYNEYNNRYIDLISQLQNLIINTMLAENNPYQQKNKNKKMAKVNLFQKKYYSILIHPFFLNNDNIREYRENQYLKKFFNHLNANTIQKMVTLTGFYKNNRNRIMKKVSCCGLVKKGEQSQAPQLLDDFLCSLKDDTFFLQGKLKFYQKYIKFKSSFNSKTLFGYTDIRVPIWDVIQFIQQKHLLSFMLHLKTTHGSLYFTHFITNPYKKIQQLYNTNIPSTLNFNNRANKDAYKQLSTLQSIFQSEFCNLMKDNNLIIDKLSTYLSNNGQYLSICIEYHENRKDQTTFFEIKSRNTGEELEYMFIHDENNKNKQMKQLLQRISAQMINYQTSTKNQRDNLPNTSLPFNLEYSIIEQKQKNRISFIRQPSFLRKSRYQSNSQENTKNNQASFLHLLSSKNFLTNNQTETISDKEELNNNVQIQKQNKIQQLQHQQNNYTSFNLKNQSNILSKQTIPIKKYSNRQSKSKIHRQSIQTKSSSRQQQISINYKTVLLIIGILFGINLLLNKIN